MSGKRTLYVSGFSSKTRAKDLAAEFERYGNLVRCDIPAPKNSQSRVYAFVEFEDNRDAETALDKLHNFPIDKDHFLEIQWAKQPPSSIWRFDGPPPPRGPPGEGRARSRSPPRRRDDRGPPGPRAERSYDNGPRGGYDDRRGGPAPYEDRGGRRGAFDERRPPSGGYESRSSYDDRGRNGYAAEWRGGYPTEPRSAGGYSDSRNGHSDSRSGDPRGPASSSYGRDSRDRYDDRR